jgi:transposase
MPRGPKLQPLELSASETAQLTAWSRRRKTARALAERARIILGSASGAPNLTVAAALGVTHQTVGKWRQRFLTARLDGLLDTPRPGAPRSITDGDVERVIRQTLESRPTEATQWSSRSMARAVGLSQTAVVRIWHAYGLQPHLWMRKRRCKPSTGRRHICRSARDNRPAEPTTTSGTAPPRCSPPWMLRRGT